MSACLSYTARFDGIKNAFLVATSIPFHFYFIYNIKRIRVTLNIVVLFGLMLVLGIIVDDAIVVTENIYRLGIGRIQSS
ncbi:MAG: efflux RND transporter permease subunit [Ignavibacteria bacterium]|nr:efflux RND transporter permease subunit [Ignavibacteria bacterium]